MSIGLELYELQNMLNDAAELGASIALSKLGYQAEEVTQNQLYRTYGRSTVDRLLPKMKNRPRKLGTSPNSSIKINRAEFESLVKLDRKSKIRIKK